LLAAPAAIRHDPTVTTRLSPREIALVFVFWTALATLTAVNWLFDPRGFGMRVFSPGGPIASAYVEAWLWALLTLLIFRLSSWASMAPARWSRILLLFVAGVGISVGVYLLLEVFRDVVGQAPRPRRRGGGGGSGFSPFRGVARFRILNHLLTYGAILAAGFAREFFLRDQQRRREGIELAGHAARLQAQLADARLDALRMQINPHFLFNTLNAISALVERDPAGVRRMIARLSELLRRTIDSHATEEVTLREELDFLRRYIEIMEIRFQGRLRVETHADESVLDALVPNLVLQPIVENALEHGAARVTGEGLVAITARRDGERLVITVRDNGPGLAEGTSPGVGVTNTRARLEQLYGAAGRLTLADAAPGVLAEIAVPFHTETP
jgi:signal transduction histidine kinase